MKMIKNTAIGISLALLLSSLPANAFYKLGSNIGVPKGTYVCYSPEPLLESEAVFRNTGDWKGAIQVLKDTKQCTRLNTVLAIFTVTSVERKFTIKHQNYSLLGLKFMENSPMIYAIIRAPAMLS